MYLTIKTLHISCAIISIFGFTLRGLCTLYKPQWLEARWIKIVPHCVDSILLGSAIYLAIQSQQYPLENDWLTAKVTALLVYIGLGMVVIRFAKSPRQRLIAFCLALVTFAYIVVVAITRSPTPWL
jgi:uncharacterized membrane protein SirB2